MTHRRPLPLALQGTAFNTEDRVRHGVNRNRLKADDITRVSRGVYRADTTPPTSVVGEDADDVSMGALLRTIGAVLSHRSAAQWHGIPLPGWLAEVPLEITVAGRQHTSIRPNITVHRRPLGESHTVTQRGVRVTTIERTWCDLSSLFGPGHRDHLVAAGDFLVNRPWTLQGRAEPLSEVKEIRKTLAETGRYKGVRLARAALPLIRVGADSVPETLTRLALLDAGLPEPELQVLANPNDPWSPAADLGYHRWRIALQYDGKHHRTREQQERDARRDAWFQAHGWMVIRVTAADIQDGYARVIALVKGRARAVADGHAA